MIRRENRRPATLLEALLEEAEQRVGRDVAASAPLLPVAAMLLTVAVSLTLIHFLGGNPAWVLSLAERLGGPGETFLRLWGRNPAFAEDAWWATTSVVLYVVPAVATVRLLGGRVREHGLRLRGIGVHWRDYVALLALSIPFIALAARSPAFQMRYPFYPVAAGESWWPWLWSWWLLYAAQFVALEFFFRGFLVHGLKRHFGVAAVFVMVVPYTMIHFTKPLPEALAAVVGGTVLGFLSLRSGSIWWGAGLHIAIAGAMDLLALSQKGLL